MPVWLITGCSSGFGLEIAKAAIARGDKVAATSRDASKLAELEKLGALTLSLDITASESSVKIAVKRVIEKFGSIDILCKQALLRLYIKFDDSLNTDMATSGNNAGYMLEGGVEEIRYVQP